MVESIWVSVTATMLTDQQQQPLRTIAVINDITESREAVEALRVEETRLRLAMEATELGTWDWDLPRDTLIWSPRCKHMFGYGAERQLTYQDFMNALHPDDRSHANRLVEEAMDPMGNGKYDIIYRAVWPNGNVHWIQSRGQMLFLGEGENRKPVRFLGTTLDVTRLKEVEEQLRASRSELERKVEETYPCSVCRPLQSPRGGPAQIGVPCFHEP